jgi:hypothetical protein
LPNEELICGVYLMNQFAFIHGTTHWCKFDLRGNLLTHHSSPENTNEWLILGKLYIFLSNEDVKVSYFIIAIDEY